MKKFYFLVLVFLLGCQKQITLTKIILKKGDFEQYQNQVRQVETQKIDKNHTVTVFIHGTILVPEWLLCSKNFVHKFFYSTPGIHHYSEYKSIYKLRSIAENIYISNLDNFRPEGFYIFGWNGKLSFKERELATAQLKLDLEALVNNYEILYGVKPKINLITHSHGGNVALGLAKLNPNFVISKLILLACPVQKETAKFVESKVFERVISFYSSADAIQILDPQDIKFDDINSFKNISIKSIKNGEVSLFSERLFESKNVTQVQIRMNGRGIMHIEFLLKSFLNRLGFFLEKIDSLSLYFNHLIISFWT